MIDVCHITALAVQALRVAVPVLQVSVFVSPEGVQVFLGKIPEVVTGGLAVSGAADDDLDDELD